VDSLHASKPVPAYLPEHMASKIRCDLSMIGKSKGSFSWDILI